MARPGPGLMTELLSQIQENTKKYLAFLAANSLPEPSFDSGVCVLPADVEAARNTALEASDELHQLLLGPLGLIVHCPGDQYLMLGLQYIIRYDIARHVPLQGRTTFDELARAVGVDLRDVMRFLRVAISRHVFHEPAKGQVVHTAASRLLFNNRAIESWIAYIAQEIWPSLTRAVDATQRWPGSEEPGESGHSLSHMYEGGENPFDVIRRDAGRHQRFIDGMSYSHQHPSYSIDHLLNGYDFSHARLVVDVGGSHGKVAVALARRYPQLELVVQDLAETIAGLEGQVPAELRGRVRGMSHDFLTPQPVEGADVYLMRWILHDWSDKYCVKILRALVPALRSGSKVVVNDVCVPEPGQLSVAADRGLRLMDISMKAFNNARERDAADWAELFELADQRFRFLGITVPEGARMAIIQAEWVGND